LDSSEGEAKKFNFKSARTFQSKPLSLFTSIFFWTWFDLLSAWLAANESTVLYWADALSYGIDSNDF
jgi:hypothetical protein